MTRDELAAHEVASHGRDYSRSDDGYSDMEVAAEDGWHAIAGWGQDGWDLGDWPYVVVSARTLHDMTKDVPEGICYEMRQTCEGDTTVYRFATIEDRDAAIDYLFIWYGIGHEYDEWEVNGLGPRWNDKTSHYDSRDALDTGTLRVPERFRGPYSWKRTEVTS